LVFIIQPISSTSDKSHRITSDDWLFLLVVWSRFYVDCQIIEHHSRYFVSGTLSYLRGLGRHGLEKKANLPVSFNEFQARYKFNHPGKGWYQACIVKWNELKKDRDELASFFNIMKPADLPQKRAKRVSPFEKYKKVCFLLVRVWCMLNEKRKFNPQPKPSPHSHIFMRIEYSVRICITTQKSKIETLGSKWLSLRILASKASQRSMGVRGRSPRENFYDPAKKHIGEGGGGFSNFWKTSR